LLTSSGNAAEALAAATTLMTHTATNTTNTLLEMIRI
jgi:hypothetical protein